MAQICRCATFLTFCDAAYVVGERLRAEIFGSNNKTVDASKAGLADSDGLALPNSVTTTSGTPTLPGATSRNAKGDPAIAAGNASDTEDAGGSPAKRRVSDDTPEASSQCAPHDPGVAESETEAPTDLHNLFSIEFAQPPDDPDAGLPVLLPGKRNCY